jgi:hypothetical protein
MKWILLITAITARLGVQQHYVIPPVQPNYEDISIVCNTDTSSSWDADEISTESDGK